MPINKLGKYWALIIILLVAIIAIGGLVAWSRYSPSQPIEISVPSSQELPGEVYISGAISSPGIYPLKVSDSIEALIQAAGGTTNDADIIQLKLYVLSLGEGELPQKIDLNRAELRLLKALPGIDEILAQRIVNYREQNGRFNNIQELIKVKGIGIATYEQVKHLITVAD